MELAQSPEAWISTQVLQQLSNTLRKKFGKDWMEIVGTIAELCQNFAVFTNQPDTLKEALHLANKYGYSMYDCLILSNVLSVGCSTLYSEDMQNGQLIEGKLTIVNPFLP